MTLSVSIIEDDAQIRAHLVQLIDASNRCNLIGSAGDGAEARTLIYQNKTDVYIVDLGLPDVSSHSFRKTVATLIDDSGLSARIGADQLGHAKVSMTQDVYMSRGRVHTEVADMLDKTVGKSDE